MERVKKGEKYWFIDFSGLWSVDWLVEHEIEENTIHFITGNYFHTKEEAELMAKKLRAVLKGSIVIDKLPSEEEIENEALENNWIHKERGDCNYPENLCVEIFKEGIEWLKSQLTKEE